MKFSKAILTLASLFLFDQAAAAVVSSKSDDGTFHVIIPFGDGDDNGNDHKKERELETTAHDADARSLNDASLNIDYGPGGKSGCTVCGSGYRCSSFHNWNNGERAFRDPLDVPIDGITVKVFGIGFCNTSPIEVSLNGNILGVLGRLGSRCDDWRCNNTPSSDACSSSSDTYTFNQAWYNVGGPNTIKLRSTLPSSVNRIICVDRVEIDLFVTLPSSLPSSSPTMLPSLSPSFLPSSVPSLTESTTPSSLPSSKPSDLPSMVPSDIPSSEPSDLPSMVPSDIPSSEPSDLPSMVPSDIPSSEPSWLDDEQCKKKDPENDICAELDGRCKVDCETDEDFVCVPGLCSYDRYWDKVIKSPKMRELKEEEFDVVDIEITAYGNTERKLKGTKDKSTKETKFSKAPKATKAPKSSCECRVPRKKRGCKN